MIVSNSTIKEKITIDLDSLDLNYQPSVTPPKWEPTTELKPYESLNKLYLDIETTGLDWSTCRVIMIGLKDQDGNVAILYKKYLNVRATVPNLRERSERIGEG